jgi:hypothetical protein
MQVGKWLVGNLDWSVYSGRLFEVGLWINTKDNGVEHYNVVLQKGCIIYDPVYTIGS